MPVDSMLQRRVHCGEVLHVQSRVGPMGSTFKNQVTLPWELGALATVNAAVPISNDLERNIFKSLHYSLQHKVQVKRGGYSSPRQTSLDWPDRGLLSPYSWK
jgi:hypothetical protein